MNDIKLTEAYEVAASKLEDHLRRTTFVSEVSSITGSGGGMTASLPEIVEVVILAALPSIREGLASLVLAEAEDGDVASFEVAAEIVRGY